MSSLPQELFAQSTGFVRDVRFGDLLEGAQRANGASDPAEAAFADGYARGYQDAAEQAKAKAEADAAACSKLEAAFVRLSEAEGLRLEERLRETVLALCEHSLAPLANDPEALSQRISKALGALRRNEDERMLRLHPEDIALIGDRLPEGVKVEPDDTLARGEIRVETAEGGIEDGPEQWRRTLAEALAL